MTRFANRLSTLLLLLLSVLSQVHLIADSFGCRTEVSLYVWLIAACLLLWIAGSFRRGIWVGMPLSALLLYLAYRFYDADAAIELGDFLDRITGAFYSHVMQPGMPYPYADAAASHSLILVFLGFLLAAYLITALTAKNARISLSLLGTLPIFASCIVVNGTPPALSCAGILLFWFLLLITGGSYLPDGSIGRSFFCVLLPLILLLGGILYFFRPETYSYTQQDIALSLRFDRLNHYFDLLTGRSESDSYNAYDPNGSTDLSAPRSSYHSSWDGEDESMQLSNPYDFDRAETKVLQVRAQVSGRLYLRTQSFGDYLGTGWAPAEELSSGSSLPFAAFAAAASAEGTERQLEVRTLLELNQLCLPYYAPVAAGSDNYVPAGDQISYRVSYTEYKSDVSLLRLPQESRDAELTYRGYAHSTYTRLPDATAEAALRLCREAGLRADDPNLIQAVAEYVQQSGTYDLSTGAYPGEDYALYFLTQAHRGYCIHYATAAAVLYRALGVPARVTEGFMIDAPAGSFADVTAGNAHAWVEVYLDGTGWIPVEVTAQAGIATQELPPSPTPVPTEPPASSPEPASQEQTDPSPSPTPEDSTQPSLTPEDDSSIQQDESRHFPWIAVEIVLALLLLLPLWYALARARFWSQIRSTDSKRAAVACWRYGKKAASFGGELPALLEQTAEKAAFSSHIIRKEELSACQEALQGLIDQVYIGLSPVQKFRFRFLRGLK